MMTQWSERKVRVAGGFTLLEVVLALSLATLLLAAVTTALQLYMKAFDAGRTDVAEAQLMRGLLGRLTADLRSLPAVAAKREAGGEAMRPGSTASTAESVGAGTSGVEGPRSSGKQLATTGATVATDGPAERPTGAADASGFVEIGGVGNEAEAVLQGTSSELRLEVIERPRLWPLPSGEAPGSAQLEEDDSAWRKAEQAGWTSVRYWFASEPEAEADELAKLGTTAANQDYPALIRESRPRVPVGSEQSNEVGRSSAGESGGGAEWRKEAGDRKSEGGRQATSRDTREERLSRISVPEVAGWHLRYFDGSTWSAQWDSRQRGGLPVAVEVRLAVWRGGRKPVDGDEPQRERVGQGSDTREGSEMWGEETPELGGWGEADEELQAEENDGRWIVVRELIRLPQAAVAQQETDRWGTGTAPRPGAQGVEGGEATPSPAEGGRP